MFGGKATDMKRITKWHKPYGLRAKFGISLLISGLICGVLFGILYFVSEALITDHFAKSDFEEAHMKRQGENLQEYIDKNGITSKDLSKLKSWEKKQPIILLELYENKDCIYSSFYQMANTPVGMVPKSDAFDDWNNKVSIKLSDKVVTAVLYSDFTYQYYVLGTAFAFAISLALFVIIFLWNNRKMIKYICKLNNEVQILEGGNLEYEVSIEGNDEITDLAKSMNRMRESLQEQMNTEQQLYQANRRLITEMSHDLRTPLTSLMLYTEILRTQRYETKVQLQDYLEKIDAKAHYMKQLTDHLFEYALDGTSIKYNEQITMKQAFLKSVSNMISELETRGFNVFVELDWDSCFIQVKQEYINRIVENIASNIIKYAEIKAEVQIRTINTDKYTGISILNSNANGATNEDSTQIGLDSIRNMMKKMNGICSVEQTEAVFEISILFPKQCHNLTHL